MVKPIDLITNLRKSDEYIEILFMHGSCYKFYLFLKSVYPWAMPYITVDKDHVVTRIGGDFYDINGYYNKRDITHMSKSDIELAETWSFKKQNLIKLTECEVCGEPFVYKK